MSHRLYARADNSSRWTRRAYHGSAVVGNYVYIDGGEQAIGQNSSVWEVSVVDQTLAIDLSFSWTNSTVDFVATNKSSAPSINFQALWHDPDENVLYSFGGESTWLPPISGNPPPLSVWKFAPDDRGGGRWSENTTSSDPPFSDGLIRPFGGSTTSSNNTAFYLGGYSSKQSSPKRSSGLDFIPARGIISYSYRNGSWSNDTAAGYSQYATAEWGGVQFVPSLGPEGVLVIFGGDTSTATAYSPGEYLRPMTNITVYEPRSRTWYYQNATGDSLPAARIRMCVVGVQESSNSSYEIFMYAGYDGTYGPTEVQFDQVWVLSLPAFRWFKANYTATNSRIGHTCHVVGNRQLLTIGGVDPTQSDLVGVWRGPDRLNQGLGIFDMSAMTWLHSYNASAAAYVRPDVVKAWYDQNGPYPSTWDQPALKSLIQNNSTITAIPAATSSPSPSSSNRDHSHAGAIAGGVLGGIACLLLIILGIRLLLRRRNQVRNQQPQVPDGKNGVYQGLNELSADNNRPELSTHIPRVELGSGLPVGSEMEQPARDETSHEMPAGKS